jgi:O-antigen/teichoic acid export membrane protein
VAQTKRELFISNTVYNSGFKLFNQLIALFVLPLFIKNLGAELYGIWIISGVLIGYLEMVDLGFSEGVMREVSNTYANKDVIGFRKVINSSLFLFILIGIVILILIILFRDNIINLLAVKAKDYELAKQVLLTTAFFAPFLWGTRLTGIIFQGTLKFKEYSILSGFQSLGKTVTMIVLLYLGYGIIDIIVYTNIVFLLLWIPSAYVLLKISPETKIGFKYFSRNTLVKIAPFSFAVFYAQIISMLALQADNLIIGVAISMTGITAYTVASKLFYTSYTYMGMISGVFQPTSYQAFAQNDRGMIEKLMFKGTKYMTLLYTPVGYIGIIISPLFIETWVGKEYLPYAIWSQLFMAVFVLTSGYGLPVNLAFNSGQTKSANIFKTTSVIVNLIIGILLVKKYGIGGPIIGTLVAGLIGPLTFPYFCGLIGVEWKKPFIETLKIIVVNLPMAIFFYWMATFLSPGWFNLLWFSGLIIIVFFLTLYFSFFDDDEKKDVLIFVKVFSFKK